MSRQRKAGHKAYDHWFWNSKAMKRFAVWMGRFSTWLWQKQYGGK